MKIVFLIGNMSNGGGTERVLSVIAGGLSERGHQPLGAKAFVLSSWKGDRCLLARGEGAQNFGDRSVPEAGRYH